MMKIDAEKILMSLSDRVQRPERTERRSDGKLYCCECGEVLEKDKYFELFGKTFRINTICSCLRSDEENEEKRRNEDKKSE